MMLLEQTLSEIRSRPKGSTPALMTHAVLGYPTLRESIELVKAMAGAGAALIELQIPFSDPMADGPTIMSANETALSAGTKVKDCFRAAEILSASIDVPLLFMSYYNILYRHPGGVKAFCRHAAESGIEGLIVPDIPPEESVDGYWTETVKNSLCPIPVVAPVSGPERLRAVKKVTHGGFVYCVSTTGTTGARSALPSDLPQYLKTVRKVFGLPLGVGFGISSPEQVRQLKGHAEIAIVGSAMVDKIRKSSAKGRLRSVANFTRSLCSA